MTHDGRDAWAGDGQRGPSVTAAVPRHGRIRRRGTASLAARPGPTATRPRLLAGHRPAPARADFSDAWYALLVRVAPEKWIFERSVA
jgi:hypothetical protein